MDGSPLRKFALTSDVPNSRRATPFAHSVHCSSLGIPIPYLMPPRQAVRVKGYDNGEVWRTWTNMLRHARNGNLAE